MCGYNQVKRKPILTLFDPFTATFFAVGRATRRTKKLARQKFGSLKTKFKIQWLFSASGQVILASAFPE